MVLTIFLILIDLCVIAISILEAKTFLIDMKKIETQPIRIQWDLYYTFFTIFMSAYLWVDNGTLEGIWIDKVYLVTTIAACLAAFITFCKNLRVYLKYRKTKREENLEM